MLLKLCYILVRYKNPCSKYGEILFFPRNMATFGAFFFFFFQKLIWTVCDPSFKKKISKWQKIAKKKNPASTRGLKPNLATDQIQLKIFFRKKNDSSSFWPHVRTFFLFKYDELKKTFPGNVVTWAHFFHKKSFCIIRTSTCCFVGRMQKFVKKENTGTFHKAAFSHVRMYLVLSFQHNYRL